MDDGPSSSGSKLCSVCWSPAYGNTVKICQNCGSSLHGTCWNVSGCLCSKDLELPFDENTFPKISRSMEVFRLFTVSIAFFTILNLIILFVLPFAPVGFHLDGIPFLIVTILPWLFGFSLTILIVLTLPGYIARRFIEKRFGCLNMDNHRQAVPVVKRILGVSGHHSAVASMASRGIHAFKIAFLFVFISFAVLPVWEFLPFTTYVTDVVPIVFGIAWYFLILSALVVVSIKSYARHLWFKRRAEEELKKVCRIEQGAAKELEA